MNAERGAEESFLADSDKFIGSTDHIDHMRHGRGNDATLLRYNQRHRYIITWGLVALDHDNSRGRILINIMVECLTSISCYC
jgi:hypothetical protein